MAALRWVPPTRDDDDHWAELLGAIEAIDGRGETFEIDDLADEWSSVWAHPETDSLFVWDGPELVAFGWLKTIAGQKKEHRIECWGGVRPSRRREGIGTSLLEWQVRRASEIAGGLDASLPTRIGIDALDSQHDLVALAAGLGFTPARRFLEVARPVAEPLPAITVPEGLELVDWSAGLDASVRAAHADSFADHWGSEPRTEEEWRQWYTGHRAFRPELSCVALDQATGDVASFVLCAAYPQDWHSTPVEAWINTVGTTKAWRGRGAARAALTGSLQRVAASESGFERAILGVDAQNPTGALQLYRSLGFADVRGVTMMGRPPLQG